MTRRLGAVLVALALLAPLTACSGDDEPARGAAKPTIEGPDVRASVRPQRLGPGTRLLGCSNGLTGTAARVASVVVPRDFLEFGGMTATEMHREELGPESGSVICHLGVVTPMEFRRSHRSAFVITLPTQQPLREAVRRFALKRGPAPVVERAAVLGSPDGERATYRAREFSGSRIIEVVAVQAGGVRLTWLGPTRPLPGQRARDRRLWQRVQDSLAVRSPAAADGDEDADSDPGGPAEPTDEVTEFAPSGATRHPRFVPVRCTRKGVTVTLLLPARIPDRRGCRWERWLPSPWEGETVHVTIGPRGPLRAEYEEVHSREDGRGGDVETSGVEYDSDVPGPGGLRAESLVYTSANDGAPQEYHLIQAGGIRLEWIALPGAWGPQLDELPIVLASLGVTTGR